MQFPQEIHFAHHLASNEPNVRRRAIAKLRKWVTAKSSHVMSGFTEESMMQLWKGLFFCMWMADKPLVQQDVAEEMSSLIHNFGRHQQALLFADCFFKTMAREWFAIDRYRLDKFMMLVRRFFRQSLVFTYHNGWQTERIRDLCAILRKTVLHPSSRDVPIGLKTHVTDIFIQELARIQGSELTSEQSVLFLEPFFNILVKTPHQVLRKAVRDNVFNMMMDLDTEYPKEDISGGEDSREKGEEDELAGSESEDEYDEEGRLLENSETSVDLPAIPFDYEAIAKRFNQCSKKEMKTANRNVITSLIKKFWYLTRGVNPRKIVDEDSGSDLEITEGHITEAVRRLEEEETELRKEREEPMKLKRSSKQEGGEFAFNTFSGTYDHTGVPCSSESSSDADTESANDEDEVERRKKVTSKGKLKLRTAMKAKKLKMEVTLLESSDDSEVDNSRKVNVSNSTERQQAGKLKKRAAALSDILEENDNGILRKENETLQRLVPKGACSENSYNAVEGETKQKKKQKQKKKATNASVIGDETAEFEGSSLFKQVQITSGKRSSKISDKSGKAKVSNGDISTKRHSTQKPKDNALEESGDAVSSKGDDSQRKLLPKGVSSEGPVHAVGVGTKRKRKRKKDAPDSLIITKRSWGNESLSLKKKQVSSDRKGFTVSERTVKTESNNSKTAHSRDAKLSKNGAPSSIPEENNDEILRKENEKLQRLLIEGVCCKKSGPVERATKQRQRRNRKRIATDTSVIENTSTLTEESSPLKKKFALETRVSAVTEEMKKEQNAAKQKKLEKPVSSGRRVNFLLSKNQAHDPKDYLESLKASPQMPFNASKRPVQGVLKMTEASIGSAPNRASSWHH